MLSKTVQLLLLLAIAQTIHARHSHTLERQFYADDDLEGELVRVSRRNVHEHYNPNAESEFDDEPVQVAPRDVSHTHHSHGNPELQLDDEPVQVARRGADDNLDESDDEHVRIAPRGAEFSAEDEHSVAARQTQQAEEDVDKQEQESPVRVAIREAVDQDAQEIDAESEPVQVAPRATVEDYKKDCNLGHLMIQLKKMPIQSPLYGTPTPYPGGIDCSWQLTGEAECIVEIVCSDMDLKESPDCEAEHLEISDGIGGRERFCGKKPFTQALKAIKGYRDLFIRFKSAETGTGRKGFNCEARCSANVAGAKELAVNVRRKEEPRCVCGLQNKDDRIVGGQDAKMNEFPWQVAIVMKGTRSPKCGGAFINDRYILTAAHCFALEGQQPHEIDVLFHVQSLDMTKQDGWKDVALGQEGSIRGKGYNDPKKTDKDEKTQRFTVTKIINNPLFTPTYDYDVSLLRIEPVVDLSHPDAPTPICLPELSYKEQYVGKAPWVVGWGLPDEKAGGTTRLLQKLDVPILEFSKCASWTTAPLTSRMLCAGYEEGKRDACTGDSGGPLSLKKDNNQWEQIGVVSWGEGCAQAKKPGYYSRVTELQQFIRYHSSDAKWCKDTKG